jgi:hypothetical protein
MAREILDRSREQMVIFNRDIEVDKTLPKWSSIEKIAQEEVNKELEVKEDVSNAENKMLTASNPVEFNNNRAIVDEVAKAASARLASDKIADVEKIDKMDVDQFNLYLEKRRLLKVMDSWAKYSENSISFGTPIREEDASNNPTLFRRMKNLFGEFIKEREEMRKIDIIQFFANVKLSSKKSQQAYAKRVAPIIATLRDANEMGQQALVDALLGEAYREKYESVLYAAGVLYKITEKEMVKFINKTEKGVALDYVSNFARPIPKTVLTAKKKADTLHVFDNYVVLYYDPEGQKRLPTAEEKEKERQRKADPILFGVIKGVRALYYVADWIDEYCDLTLEEFLKVSDIKRKEIELKQFPTVTVNKKEVELQ